MTKLRIVGLGVGLLVLVSAFSFVLWQGTTSDGAGVALAQGAPTATPSAQPTKAPTQQGTVSDLTTAFWNALASRLGVTVDDLKSKVVDAQKAALEQAVTNGTLTRAQADALEQRLNTNAPFAPFFGGRRGGFPGEPGGAPGIGPRGGFLGGVATLEAVAKALNLTPADLNTQLQSGKTLTDIAKTQNVAEATVKQAIIDATKAQIQRAVQDGLLTQAQADDKLTRLTPDQIDLTRTRGFGGPGPGWR